MNETTNTIELAVALTTAWLGNPNTRCTPDEVHAFVRDSHAAIVGLSDPAPAADGEAEVKPDAPVAAVTVRKSLADPEVILSMIDGKPYRALRRHLTTHGMTPETYRERYGLKADYPMVAPAYAAKRSELAKALGLGRKGAAARAANAAASLRAGNGEPASPAKRGGGRKPRAANRSDQAENA